MKILLLSENNVVGNLRKFESTLSEDLIGWVKKVAGDIEVVTSLRKKEKADLTIKICWQLGNTNEIFGCEATCDIGQQEIAGKILSACAGAMKTQVRGLKDSTENNGIVLYVGHLNNRKDISAYQNNKLAIAKAIITAIVS